MPKVTECFGIFRLQAEKVASGPKSMGFGEAPPGMRFMQISVAFVRTVFWGASMTLRIGYVVTIYLS